MVAVLAPVPVIEQELMAIESEREFLAHPVVKGWFDSLHQRGLADAADYKREHPEDPWSAMERFVQDGIAGSYYKRALRSLKAYEGATLLDAERWFNFTDGFREEWTSGFEDGM